MGNLYSNTVYDDELVLKDAGLIAATATESTILDIGGGVIDDFLVIDVTAVEVASADEKYTIHLEGSNVSVDDELKDQSETAKRIQTLGRALPK